MCFYGKRMEFVIFFLIFLGEKVFSFIVTALPAIRSYAKNPSLYRKFFQLVVKANAAFSIPLLSGLVEFGKYFFVAFLLNPNH